jgi:hypothetical protein
MSAPRVFEPENRLAGILTETGGHSAAELIAAADKRVAALAPVIRAYVEQRLAVILAHASKSEDVIFAECRALGDVALDIAAVAGAAGMETVGEITQGIGAMVEGLFSSGAWHSDALLLHIEALSLVEPEGSPANREILDNLRAMRLSIGLAE